MREINKTICLIFHSQFARFYDTQILLFFPLFIVYPPLQLVFKYLLFLITYCLCLINIIIDSMMMLMLFLLSSFNLSFVYKAIHTF